MVAREAAASMYTHTCQKPELETTPGWLFSPADTQKMHWALSGNVKYETETEEINNNEMIIPGRFASQIKTFIFRQF